MKKGVANTTTRISFFPYPFAFFPSSLFFLTSQDGLTYINLGLITETIYYYWEITSNFFFLAKQILKVMELVLFQLLLFCFHANKHTLDRRVHKAIGKTKYYLLFNSHNYFSINKITRMFRSRLFENGTGAKAKGSFIGYLLSSLLENFSTRPSEYLHFGIVRVGQIK